MTATPSSPASPDKLELRSKPNVGPRLGRRAILIGGGVVALFMALIVYNTESRKTQMEAKPRQEEAIADKKLRPSTDAAEAFTKGVPDGLSLAITPAPVPAATAASPALAPQVPPAAAGEGGVGYDVPDLTGASAGPAPDLGVSQAQLELQQEREQREREARRSGTGLADWTSSRTASDAGGAASGANAGPSMQDLASAMPSLPGMAGVPQTPADQEKKRAFIDKAKELEPPVLNATRQAPRSAFELKTGHVIPAAMLRGVNSDLPGELTAIVTESVYDTATGRFCLIPAGSKLFGHYDSEVVFGQSRALVVWTRLVFPDGSTLELGGMQGSDQAGYAGFKDKVNNHYGRLVGFALLTSVMSSAYQLSQPQDTASGETLTNQQIVSAEVGRELTQLGLEVTRKNLNIQPTIEIRPGYRFIVTVNRDVAFAEAYSRR